MSAHAAKYRSRASCAQVLREARSPHQLWKPQKPHEANEERHIHVGAAMRNPTLHISLYAFTSIYPLCASEGEGGESWPQQAEKLIERAVGEAPHRVMAVTKHVLLPLLGAAHAHHRAAPGRCFSNRR